MTGSLAPDFHYFLNLWPHGHFTHSIRGIFVFSLPVGLALLWIFQRIMKLPLISLAPQTHQARLVAFASPFRWGPFSRFLLILFALMVGIGSHVVWDAFTHGHGFFVRNVPDLQSPAFEEFGTDRPVWNLLQHGSTLLGMAVLPLWYWLWLRRAPRQEVPAYLRLKTSWKRWISASILILAGSTALADAWIDSDHLASRGIFAGTCSVMFMSLVFVGILIFSAWWHWRNRGIRSSGHPAIGSPESSIDVGSFPTS